MISNCGLLAAQSDPENAKRNDSVPWGWSCKEGYFFSNNWDNKKNDGCYKLPENSHQAWVLGQSGFFEQLGFYCNKGYKFEKGRCKSTEEVYQSGHPKLQDANEGCKEDHYVLADVCMPSNYLPSNIKAVSNTNAWVCKEGFRNSESLKTAISLDLDLSPQKYCEKVPTHPFSTITEDTFGLLLIVILGLFLFIAFQIKASNKLREKNKLGKEKKKKANVEVNQKMPNLSGTFKNNKRQSLKTKASEKKKSVASVKSTKDSNELTLSNTKPNEYKKNLIEVIYQYAKGYKGLGTLEKGGHKALYIKKWAKGHGIFDMENKLLTDLMNDLNVELPFITSLLAKDIDDAEFETRLESGLETTLSLAPFDMPKVVTYFKKVRTHKQNVELGEKELIENGVISEESANTLANSAEVLGDTSDLAGIELSSKSAKLTKKKGSTDNLVKDAEKTEKQTQKDQKTISDSVSVDLRLAELASLYKKKLISKDAYEDKQKKLLKDYLKQ